MRALLIEALTIFAFIVALLISGAAFGVMYERESCRSCRAERFVLSELAQQALPAMTNCAGGLDMLNTLRAIEMLEDK
ncbi:MAG: hypothetical protein ACYTEQ_01750 [Planctomycetota bacterium]|jgi:hypothetical protein